MLTRVEMSHIQAKLSWASHAAEQLSRARMARCNRVYRRRMTDDERAVNSLLHRIEIALATGKGRDCPSDQEVARVMQRLCINDSDHRDIICELHKICTK